MIYVKIHKDVIALCDENIIGKTFEDEKRRIEVSERFYKGELVDEEEVVEILKEGKNMNLVGNKVIEIALKIGVAEKKDIIVIGEVKHVQIYSVE
ncbi:MAG: DUF424 family protein [archaeon]